jgi:hypothetical protein
MTDPIKFEEYKMFIEDTARFTERRQNASNLYVTINSLILTAIVFVFKDLGADPFAWLLLLIPVVAAGITVSLWWGQLIWKYKVLVGFRINMLRKMEKSSDLAGIERMYHAEDELYPRDEQGNMIKGVKLNFSDLEARLPILFIILYGFAGAVLVANLIILLNSN